MIKILFLERVISFENGFNNFLYFLSQIPGIGRLITENSYERNVAKKVLSVVNFVLSVLMNFVGKVIYVGLFFVLPYLVMKNFVVGNHFTYENTIINIFIMMNCICGSFIGTAVLSDADEDYMLLHIMRVNPVKHYRAKILFRMFSDMVFFVAILWALGIEYTISFRLGGILLASRGIGEGIRLLIYDKLPWLFEHLTILDVCLIVACVYYAYVSPCLKGYMPGLDALALEEHVYWIILLLGIVGILMAWFYKKYELLAKRKVRYTDVLYQDRVTTRARIQATKSETIKHYHVGKYDKKNGFRYLNALFFERCKKMVWQQVLGRVYVVVILTATCCLWLYMADPVQKNSVWNILTGMTTPLMLIMLLLSSAYKQCQIIFYNCDRMLLEFSYYRTRDAIKDNFISRLCHIIGMDIVTAVFLCIAVVAITFYTGNIQHIVQLIPLFVEIVALSIFYSVFETALYHMIQPYNRKLAVKVPFYHLCNGILLFVAVVLALFKIPMVALLIGTIVLDIVIIVMAYQMVADYGMKYFKIR